MMAFSDPIGSFSSDQPAERFFEEGKRLYASGDLDAAIDQFSGCLKLNPGHTGAKVLRIQAELARTTRNLGDQAPGGEFWPSLK